MAAPQCDISPKLPPANPGAAKGFRTIPTSATLPQAIRIINENFLRMSPFNSFNFFGGGSAGAGSAGRPGQNAKEGNWTQKSIVTQKVRVFQTNADGTINRDNFVDVVRVNNLVEQDHTTGATWVYNRHGVDGPNIEILQS